MADMGPVVIVADGSIGGLVCAVRESIARGGAERAPGTEGARGAAGVLWVPQDDRPARARRVSCVTRLAELTGFAAQTERQLALVDASAARALSAAGVAESGISGVRLTTQLLSAIAEARSIGASRVIWPAHAGGHRDRGVDVDALTAITDRALLVSQLAMIDGGESAVGTVRIETPLADLTDEQVMDLALDLDAPLHAAWWCLNEQSEPCGHCSQCLRWREALAAVDPAQAVRIGA